MSKGSPAELQVLAREIGRIAARKRPAAAHALAEQPFDRELLREPLFRKSRELFLKQGGKFRVALVSSPRTLSSPILLENRIDYSPIESELIWAATDPREKRNPAHLATLRTYTSSLFHEQNHRILWKMLPGIPAERRAAGRYLNFVESLVVAADMALGDKMGPKAAAVYYLSGAAYDPGTLIRARLGRARDYRNYLQAALFATYLYLCFYEPREIARALPRLFPELSAADAAHAAS
ncbi:MAG: hypothetical protein ACXVBW_12530, partial [Bdellovibrionota bacterium]